MKVYRLSWSSKLSGSSHQTSGLSLSSSATGIVDRSLTTERIHLPVIAIRNYLAGCNETSQKQIVAN